MWAIQKCKNKTQKQGWGGQLPNLRDAFFRDLVLGIRGPPPNVRFNMMLVQ